MIITESQLRSLIREAIEDMDRRGFLKLFGSGLAAATASGMSNLASAESSDFESITDDLIKKLSSKEINMLTSDRHGLDTLRKDCANIIMYYLFFGMESINKIEEKVKSWANKHLSEIKSLNDNDVQLYSTIMTTLSTHVRSKKNHNITFIKGSDGKAIKIDQIQIFKGNLSYEYHDIMTLMFGSYEEKFFNILTPKKNLLKNVKVVYM